MKYGTVLVTILGICAISLVYIDWVKSLHCGDFTVQGDAQFFYYLGAHQLDGKDQDGKVCEFLPEPRAGVFYF